MNQEQLNQLPKWRQRQDSVADQMADLRIVANRLGFYDAADAIKQLVTRLPDLKYACYCEAYFDDGEWHEVDRTCVLDSGDINGCAWANEGMRKEQCDYWRIIKK